MRNNLKSAAIILAFSLITPSALAQDFELANLTLGLTPAEVKTKMAEIGYTPYKPAGSSEILRNLSFAQKVKKEQGEYLSRGDGDSIERMYYSKNERESVTVEFEPYPSGDFVNKIVYGLKDKTLSQSKFQQRVHKKYGKPELGTPILQIWSGDQKMSRDNISSKETLHFMPMNFMINLSSAVSKSDYEKALLRANPRASDETTF